MKKSSHVPGRPEEHHSMHGPRPKGMASTEHMIDHEYHRVSEAQHPHLKEHMAFGAAQEGTEHDESKETY